EPTFQAQSKRSNAMFGIFKPVKYVVLAGAGTLLVGGAIFGREVFSYLNSSARSMQAIVKDSVPVEFQLRRARDLVNDIVPEMHANIKLIAQEEVEIESLKADIDQSQTQLAMERARVGKLRDVLATDQTSFKLGDIVYSRQQVKEDLAHRFDNLK